MKKICSLLLAAVLLLSMAATFSFTASAALPDKISYKGTEYFDVTKKADYYNVVRHAFANLDTKTYVCFKDGAQDYEDSYTNDVRNFTGINTVTIFDYAGYSPNTVCFTDNWSDPENTTEYTYGTINIEFSDSKEELQKANAILDRDLSGIKNESVKDKVCYVADYVCSKTQYGSKELPGGGWDLINGVYEALTGYRTNTVCATYAMTFQYIMEYLDVDSRLICNGYHAWNIVKIDNYWYGVDCTQDAGSTIESEYLLMSGDYMKNRYSVDKKNWFADVVKDYMLAPTTQKPATTTAASPTVVQTTGKSVTVTQKPINDTTETAVTADTAIAAEATTVEQGITTAQAALAITVKADSEPVKADVFQTAKDSQVAVKIEGATYDWYFAAQDLKNVETIATGFDSRVYTDEAITTEQRKAVAAVTEEAHFVFSFAHHGALPGKATISLQVDPVYAGKTVDVYSIDDSGKAVKECTVTVDDAAELTFNTEHCSVWFITEAAENSLSWLWIAIVGGTVLLIGIAVLCVVLRKKGVNNRNPAQS